jgi:hypothetical protein
MRRDTVVSAPKRARIDAPGSAAGVTTSHARSDGSRHAHYAALGRYALANMRATLGWCVETLRFPRDRHRRDTVDTPHEQ